MAKKEYEAKVEQAKNDLNAIINGETLWTLEEQKNRVEEIEKMDLQNPEIDELIVKAKEVLNRETAEPVKYEKPWATTGTKMQRKHNIVNSLYLKPEELEKKNFERFAKYKTIEENEVMYEEYLMDDAEICVVSFGITSRVAKNAIVEARAKGIKVGMIRPITLWPFPTEVLNKAADKCKAFISVEMNMGQMIEDVKLAIECKKPVELCCRVGGMIPSPEEVLEKIEEVNKGGER